MLMQNSFYLNSIHMFADSLKEDLKKTMLDQEIIFRTQVQELHRLYKIQKMLMDNIDLKQFDRYTLRKAWTQSSWLFHSFNPAGQEPSVSLVEDTKFSSTAMVASAHSNSPVFPDRHRSVCYSIHQRPLDFQLPANHLTSYVDQQELNLSLSIGEENRRRICDTLTCFDKKNNSYSQNIINLEEPTEGISNEEENHVACSTFHTVTQSESQISVLSEQIISSGKIIISGETEKSNCPFGSGECCCGENSAGTVTGFQRCHKALTANKSSIKNEQCNESGKLDLNQVQLNDSSRYSSDHIVASHSTTSLSHIFGIYFDKTLETTCPSTTWRNKSSKYSYEVSDILQWNDGIDSVLMNSNSESDLTDTKCNGIEGSEAGLTGNKAVSRTQVSTSKDLGYCMGDPENKNIGSIWELSDDQSTHPDSRNLATRMVNYDSSKDDEFSCAFQSPTQVKDGDGNIVAALRESSSIVDKSGSIKTRQSQINLGNTNLITCDQHLGPGSGNQLGHDCPKEVEPPKVAMSIQTAAQLLMNFSLGSSSQAESIEIDKGKEKPQCSDSFEVIALKLEECNADDCCVSSKPYEIEGTEKKDFAFKLKRGRRLKDFQREILPALASLSRDEIEEDINILEAVLRSREYWKIRARMADQSSWCAPVRSRRSKRNYVRRRIF